MKLKLAYEKEGSNYKARIIEFEGSKRELDYVVTRYTWIAPK